MRNRTRRALPWLLAIVTIALVGPGAAWAQHGDSGSAETTAGEESLLEIPEAVRELFTEVDEDEKLVIGLDLRAYFTDLPTHAHNLFVEAYEEGMITDAVHARDLLSLRLEPDKVELVLNDNCILCHTSSEMQFEETLMWIGGEEATGPAHLSLAEFLSDVHFRRGLSCAGCHGGSPDDLEMADVIYERWPAAEVRRENRTWIPGFCGNCHADPATMQRYNPSLPTDQLAKYRTSKHGELLLQQGDSNAAQCVSCHGIHGIRGANSRRSLVHPQAIPSTCGACHSDAEKMAGYTLPDGSPLPIDQEAKYAASVHGRALLERGDLGAPACNDCHGNHAARPPQVAYVSQVCRMCHSMNGSLFDGSNHKQAFAKNGWPECETCHGKHAIAKTTVAMLGTQPGDLCYDCHADYAPNNPQCNATADFFRETIQELSTRQHHFEEEIERLAERGLDTEFLEGKTAELHDVVRTARSAIHAFDRSDFDQIAAEGRAAAAAGLASIDEQMHEYRFRRTGLTISIGVLSFLALMLWLKIRQIEKQA